MRAFARRLSRLQTEQPLLLFLALGSLLFAADAALRSTAPGNANSEAPTIVIGGEHARKLLARHPSARERSPTPSELREALGAWIEEEALAQEARAIGLDSGDVIVRRRLAQKMRAILSQLHPVSEPSDDTLRALLEAEPARHGQPATLSFDQVFLSRARHGDALDRVATQMLEKVREDGVDFASLGDTAPTGPSVTGITSEVLARRYGRSFAQAVEALPTGSWRGPLTSSLGAHLVRVTARSPFRPATLEDVREELTRIHRIAQRRELDDAAIDALIARHAIEVRPPEDGE